LSIPVLNQKQKYYGVLEMFDLVEFVTSLFDNIHSLKFLDLEKLLSSEKNFLHATVRDVVKSPLSKQNPFKPIGKGYSLFTAWETLALSGIHRIPVVSETDEICDIITQSMLIDFLWQNIEKIGELSDLSVNDFKSPESEIFSSVKASSRALTAFREMVKTGKSGLAVTDDDGKLIDNISVRDLRGIHTDPTVFYRLWSNVADYKAVLKAEFPDKTPSQLVYATPTDTFYSVVEKMATLHIHRIYVVDKQSLVPIRVITQTDILREVLSR